MKPHVKFMINSNLTQMSMIGDIGKEILQQFELKN